MSGLQISQTGPSQSHSSLTGLSGALMVCGTTSDAGKTTLVAGLCRVLARLGIKVAPFKAQNMALNSAVTTAGHEIGRAQFLQAQAANVVPEVAMNPILLKPTGERTSQVVVQGEPVGVMSATEYHDAKPELFATVLDSLADLRSRFDVVLIEGAGSPTEINLMAHDIVNLRLAEQAQVKAIVVGDIDRGGVFASLYGTVALLPDNLRSLVAGFVINKFRGDPALLLDGLDQLEATSGLPTLGVVPMLKQLDLDAEDSLALPGLTKPFLGVDTQLDVAVVQFPRISNFTDIDPLLSEPGISVRFVRSVRELGQPDLLVLPGSKSTVDDLSWLRDNQFEPAIAHLDQTGSTILGICGGYQMMGESISDDVESQAGTAAGLGLLPVSTMFESTKVLSRQTGWVDDFAVEAYQIHHGRVSLNLDANAKPWFETASDTEGLVQQNRFGTTFHGLFENDEFRQHFLSGVAERAGVRFAPSDTPFSSHRDSELNRLADHLESSIDLSNILALIAAANQPLAQLPSGGGSL